MTDTNAPGTKDGTSVVTPKEAVERVTKFTTEWPHWKYVDHVNDAVKLILTDYARQAESLEAMASALEGLMDYEFATGWRSWSPERTRLLFGVGPRAEAFLTARTTLSQYRKTGDL